MFHETTLRYSEPLIRQAVFGFWRRSIGIRFMLALVIAAAGIAMLVATRGVESWLVGALGTALVLGAGMSLAVFVVHYRNSMSKFRELGNAEATFRADEATFTMSSSIGVTTLRWSTVKELWKFRDCWLLLFSKAQFVTLPIACLSEEMQAFIQSQVEAAGGKTL